MLWTGDYSALMPANLITSAHFSVSSAMSLAKSARKRRAAEVGGVPFCLTRYWAMVDNRARLGFSLSPEASCIQGASYFICGIDCAFKTLFGMPSSW